MAANCYWDGYGPGIEQDRDRALQLYASAAMKHRYLPALATRGTFSIRVHQLVF